ncbi:unnamed protein product, partial [Pylaiella littoralis]
FFLPPIRVVVPFPALRTWASTPDPFNSQCRTPSAFTLRHNTYIYSRPLSKINVLNFTGTRWADSAASIPFFVVAGESYCRYDIPGVQATNVVTGDTACCRRYCDTCGGAGCAHRGDPADCCIADIASSGIVCGDDTHYSPCIIVDLEDDDDDDEDDEDD